ncbi:MAG: hypothetical protein JHC22_06250 [Thermoproteus sp.]|nr:hypothetical protein [Thermoproteus sp.]
MWIHTSQGSVRTQGAAIEAGHGYVGKHAVELSRGLVPDEGRMPEEPRRWEYA